jgi:lactoylglutathione lyase
MRVIYTNLRVRDLARSIKFYTQVLGMKLIRQQENEEFAYTLAWLSFSDAQEPGIELTWNHDQSEDYDLGNGFGQIVLGVEDVYKAAEKIKNHGIDFIREPGPVKGGEAAIAFLQDPDGYRIELVVDPQFKRIGLT